MNVTAGYVALIGVAMLSVAPAAPAHQVATPTTGYTLGAGDKVHITVYGEDKLSGDYNVTSTGEISFPLIGNLKVIGTPIAQVQETIRARLADGYIRDPRVTVEINTYRPFYILGEVNKPGQYPYSAGLTVQQAAAAAGGFTYRAQTRRVFLKHATDVAEHAVDVRGSIGVEPGDTIRVGERHF